jgi:hypothetical protein
MTTRPYHNPASQAEKRQVLQNDTLFARQQNALDDLGGRFAKLTPSNVTGTKPLQQVPRLPASSPWHREALPPEEPLGIAVDEMPPLEALAPNPTTATNPIAVEVDRADASSPKDGASVLSLSVNLATDNSPSDAPSTPTIKRRV